MQILKRAKGDAGEGIPWNVDPKDLRQEINHRTYKAGYTDRDGQPKDPSKIISMPSNDQYRKNYRIIFGHD